VDGRRLGRGRGRDEGHKRGAGIPTPLPSPHPVALDLEDFTLPQTRMRPLVGGLARLRLARLCFGELPDLPIYHPDGSLLVEEARSATKDGVESQLPHDAVAAVSALVGAVTFHPSEGVPSLEQGDNGGLVYVASPLGSAHVPTVADMPSMHALRAMLRRKEANRRRVPVWKGTLQPQATPCLVSLQMKIHQVHQVRDLWDM
jgi:hypothetical protein